MQRLSLLDTLIVTLITAPATFFVVYLLYRANTLPLAKDLKDAIRSPKRFPFWKRQKDLSNVIQAANKVFEDRNDSLSPTEIEGLIAFAPSIEKLIRQHSGLPIPDLIAAIETELAQKEEQKAREELRRLGQPTDDNARDEIKRP